MACLRTIIALQFAMQCGLGIILWKLSCFAALLLALLDIATSASTQRAAQKAPLRVKSLNSGEQMPRQSQLQPLPQYFKSNPQRYYHKMPVWRYVLSLTW